MALLYKRALDEAMGLSAMLVMVLLDDKIRDSQRAGLVDFVKSVPANNAYELGSKVNDALSNSAKQWKDKGIPAGAAGLLWQLKQQAG
jgi:hypothetical protein